MKIRIALAGELPANQQIFSHIDLLIEQIGDYLNNDCTKSDIQILISPSYSGKEWLHWSEKRDFPVCACCLADDPYDTNPYQQILWADTPLRNLLGEAICRKADALIVTWNENTAELSGATWELIKNAYDRKIPCIWISTKSQQTYCLLDSYYKKYSEEYLYQFCTPLPAEELHTAPIDVKKNWLFSFWEKRRTNYLKKHKADTAIHPIREDNLMKPDFEMEPEASQGEPVRKILLDKFNQFNRAAIQLNASFQTMLYQRSVLPIIASVFLAVGFYTETLLGKTLSIMIPDFDKSITITACLLAGIGFFIHGFLNLYVYRLSKSRQIKHLQKEFLNNRHTAEALRILIHLAPYGVDLDLRHFFTKNSQLYMNIRHLTDHVEAKEQHLNKKTASYILQHIEEMLNDQINYHKSSVLRYESIVSSLEKLGNTIFYIGFGVVLARGILQFILILFPVITQTSGTDINSILRSFLNMAALLLPAWAGYYSTKLQQNNFSYNLANHRHMLSRLNVIYGRVVNAEKQEELSIEMFFNVIDELTETMLVQDTLEWRQQYENSMIKPL